VPGIVLGAAMPGVALLAGKPSHMGINVDGLVCSLYHPTACSSHHRGGQCCLTGDVLSRRSTVGSGPFLRVRSPWV
jgi:hypothetical protein